MNPQGFPAVSPDSSFNTAVSFATNTSWQGYGGETTMSYLTQMAALGVQNFVSAAVGMAVLVALTRGFARRTAETLGNFWVDLTRTTLYILLPLFLVLSLLLVSQGVVQSFSPYQKVRLLQATHYDQPKRDVQGNPIKDAAGKELTETVPVTEQTLPLGPAEEGGLRPGRGGRPHPRRRRGGRGGRFGERERHHRRERAGHPGERRRPETAPTMPRPWPRPTWPWP